MQIIPLTKDKYGVWDQFCRESDDAWFWHTTDYLEFSCAFRPENKAQSKSFMVCDDTGIIAICPLLMEELENDDGGKIKRFSNAVMGGYGVGPVLKTNISNDRKEKLFKQIFSYVDELAQADSIKTTAISFVPLGCGGQLKSLTYNCLMKYGYLENSLNTQILDLTPPMEELNREVRKGHKYDIKRGRQYYTVDIFDKNNIAKETFNYYRLLHHKAAGRITRPLITFEMMYQWIIKGNGILCGLKHDSRFIGFSLVVLYKNGAYYGSASDDPEAKVKVPISHFMQWEIVQWLKKNGFAYYELGLQQYQPQLYDQPTQKDLDISLFKRGFGGKTYTVYRGKKYYDKEFMRQEILKNLDLLLARRGDGDGK